jgi:hypothetical protein
MSEGVKERLAWGWDAVRLICPQPSVFFSCWRAGPTISAQGCGCDQGQETLRHQDLDQSSAGSDIHRDSKPTQRRPVRHPPEAMGREVGNVLFP